MFVGQTRTAANTGQSEFDLPAGARAVVVQEHRHHVALHAVVQRARPGAECLGQHGQDASGRIDAGRTLAGLVVEQGVDRDVGGHVGDVHAEHETVVGLLDRDRVVVVLGVDGIDGEGEGVHEGAPVLGTIDGRDGLVLGLGSEPRGHPARAMRRLMAACGWVSGPSTSSSTTRGRSREGS